MQPFPRGFIKKIAKRGDVCYNRIDSISTKKIILKIFKIRVTIWRIKESLITEGEKPAVFRGVYEQRNL